MKKKEKAQWACKVRGGKSVKAGGNGERKKMDKVRREREKAKIEACEFDSVCIVELETESDSNREIKQCLLHHFPFFIVH